MRYIVCGLMLVLLTACGKNQPEQDSPKAEAVSPAPAVKGFLPPVPVKAEPKHFYEGKEGDTYFYSKGISENEKQSGAVSTEMLEVIYIGTKNNGYQAIMKNGSVANIISCKAPCEFFTETIVVQGQVAKTARYKNVTGSMGWAILTDAANGMLEPADFNVNGKMQKAWYSHEKERFFPLNHEDGNKQ